MYRILNNKGFTLIEVLVVLGGLCLIGLLSIRISKTYVQSIRADIFAQSLATKLALAQHEAILSGENVNVLIDMETRKVISSGVSSKDLVIPQDMLGNTVQYTFKGGTGVLNKFQRYTFTVGKIVYMIRMQFGRGVFWVEKVSEGN